MGDSGDDAIAAVVDVWRAESARVVGALVRFTRDLGEAEDAAQDALAAALEQWPSAGVPSNPGAWLVTVAKRRVVDSWRRRERLDAIVSATPPPEGAEPDLIDDDALRLVFVACHPVLGREAQIALTLRVVSGLGTDEIARAFLVPVATVQQRIVRAKRTLAAARVPFEVPDPSEYRERLAAVLDVVYLTFNEGYAATSGDALVRPELAREALRLGRILALLLPREPEVHGLVALMAFQSSRFAARVSAGGDAILLDDQDRALWDHRLIAEGATALARSDALRRGRGPIALQAAIAEVHATVATAAATDWEQIVLLYDALLSLRPSPVIALNRAVAESRAVGPASALRNVDALADLAQYAPFHAVRADLLARLGRPVEAAAAYGAAAGLTLNDRERETLRRLADELSTELSTGPSTGFSTDPSTGFSTGAAASSTHPPTGLSTGRKPVDPAQNQESR